MSQEQYNFLDELGLGKVIGNVKTMFAKLSHSHKLSDISDYTVDSAMSSTSTNPVQNKVINSALSGKVPTSRTINGKKLSSNITLSASDVGAATSSDVSSAYDLANTAKTNAATAQSKADSAYTLAESKVDSLSDLGVTATATELNYMDGVTSNVQTQLDGKLKASDISLITNTKIDSLFT